MISLQKTNVFNIKTPNTRRNTRARVSHEKDDNPIYVKLEDLEKSVDDQDVRMRIASTAWFNKYATRNSSPFLEMFEKPESVETINGRVAQIGWSFALYNELLKHQSVWNQVFNTRTFTLVDGVSDTVTYPVAGFFIIPLVTMLVLSGTIAYKLNSGKDSKEFGPFTKRAELINGRGAMIGITALSFVEYCTNGNALF